jgi:hypothetical protein
VMWQARALQRPEAEGRAPAAMGSKGRASWKRFAPDLGRFIPPRSGLTASRLLTCVSFLSCASISVSHEEANSRGNDLTIASLATQVGPNRIRQGGHTNPAGPGVVCGFPIRWQKVPGERGRIVQPQAAEGRPGQTAFRIGNP